LQLLRCYFYGRTRDQYTEEKAEAAPAALSKEQVLLTEIRDLLKK